MSPLISIIIPVYNPKYLQDALESIFTQTYKTIEVILINDGSPYDVKSVIHKFSKKIKYIEQNNNGPSAARNRGILESQGDFIYFVDADDILLPNSLEDSLSCLLSYPDAFLSFGEMIMFYPDNRSILWRPRTFDDISCRCYFKDLFLLGNFVAPGTFLIRKRFLSVTGLFDSSFRHSEDYEFGLRASFFYPFVKINKPLLKRRKHSESLSSSAINMMVGELKALKKSLMTLDVFHVLPQDDVRKRLANLSFNIGYHYWNKYQFKQARYYLGESLRFNYLTYVLLLYFMCFFPGSFIKRLKVLKSIFHF